MRSALVNEQTLVVENICVSDPVTPCPFEGLFMVGLKDPVFENQRKVGTKNFPEGTTIETSPILGFIIIPPVDKAQMYPLTSIVTTNPDGTVTVDYDYEESVLVEQGTSCSLGWIYDPANNTFNPPVE